MFYIVTKLDVKINICPEIKPFLVNIRSLDRRSVKGDEIGEHWPERT